MTPGEALDAEVFTCGVLLSDATRRFLARVRTQKVIDAGLLDEDVVRDLIEAADAMWMARVQRVTEARQSG